MTKMSLMGVRLGIEMDDIDCKQDGEMDAYDPTNTTTETTSSRLSQVSIARTVQLIDEITQQLHKQYNEKVFGSTQLMTHISYHGLKNRFGYYVGSLTIDKSVPKIKPREQGQNYGGIIVFNVDSDNSNVVNGVIYMLPSDKCYQINEKYAKENNGLTLPGQIHGAIHYYYFKQNVHAPANVQTQKQQQERIRGLAIYGGNDEEFQIKYNSTTFNYTNLYYKDRMFRELPRDEKEFIQFCLNLYWDGAGKERTFPFGRYLVKYQSLPNKKKKLK